MSNELYHHGIIGQKWGIRRFQNKDGTLTDAGRERYNKFADTERSVINKLSNSYSNLLRSPLIFQELSPEVILVLKTLMSVLD